MTKNDILDDYFDWIYQIVSGGFSPKKLSYKKLLRLLFNTEFTYSMPMDGNRYEDGIDLRYRFGDDVGVEDAAIAGYLDDKPCSVLEMMVALAFRMEEQIMTNPDIGDRTGQWFWNMVASLDLGHMSDSRFNETEAVDILEAFLDRDYAPNGEGGLFIVKHPNYDMRDAEIWNQANWYLNENYYTEGEPL